MEGVLPCVVLRPVESSAVALGVNIEDVLAAEGVGVGVVLVGAEAPFGGAGHGIDGDAAKELDLLILNLNAVDQGFEVGRVVEAVGLGDEGSFFGGILIVVDGVAHLPEVAAEFALLHSFDLKTGDRESGESEDGDDRHGDDEFDQGEAGLTMTESTVRLWTPSLVGTRGWGGCGGLEQCAHGATHFTWTTACE